MDIKFDVLMFKEIRERLESFRMRNIIVFVAAVWEEKENVNFLYVWRQKIQLD